MANFNRGHHHNRRTGDLQKEVFLMRAITLFKADTTYEVHLILSCSRRKIAQKPKKWQDFRDQYIWADFLGVTVAAPERCCPETSNADGLSISAGQRSAESTAAAVQLQL